jgi:hypothetical protein
VSRRVLVVRAHCVDDTQATSRASRRRRRPPIPAAPLIPARGTRSRPWDTSFGRGEVISGHPARRVQRRPGPVTGIPPGVALRCRDAAHPGVGSLRRQGRGRARSGLHGRGARARQWVSRWCCVRGERSSNGWSSLASMATGIDATSTRTPAARAYARTRYVDARGNLGNRRPSGCTTGFRRGAGVGDGRIVFRESPPCRRARRGRIASPPPP